MFTSMTESECKSTLFFVKMKDCCKLLMINEMGRADVRYSAINPCAPKH